MINTLLKYLDNSQQLWFLSLLFRKYEHFIKYSIIGVMGVSIDFVVFYLLNNKLEIHYQISNLISVNCGIINNFIFNSRYNFKMRDKILLRFFQFYIVGFIGLTISSILLLILIEKLGIYEIISKGIVIIVITFTQFNLNRIFTFRKYKEID